MPEAWVNDEDTQRGWESGNHAERVFCSLLQSGHPPDGWRPLLAEASAEGSRWLQVAAGIAL